MPEPSQYPIFLDLVQCPVLVVGGGAVALRKTRGLLQAHARVTVVAPEFCAGFKELKGFDRITAPYAATHMTMKMWRLVFITTNDQAVNDTVQKHAAAHGIFSCRSDEHELGDFSGGAAWVSDSGHVTIAVATAGASPAIAMRIRDAAVAGVDSSLIAWAALIGPWRKRTKREVRDPVARRELLSRISGPAMEECLRAGGEAAATALFNEWLAELHASTALNRVPDHGK